MNELEDAIARLERLVEDVKEIKDMVYESED